MKRIKDGDEYIAEINVDQEAATKDAIYVTDGDVKAWIPRSQIIDSEKEDGKLISIIIPEWLAIEKGFV